MEEVAKLIIPVGPQDRLQGNPKAALVLVEYGDYQCPHCAQAYSIVKAVQEGLGKKLCFVFRNFPLGQIHPYAELAAEAAESAGAQGKFWEMHDAIYENQDSLGPDLIMALGKKLVPDLPRYVMDLEKRTYQAKVREDFMGGVKSGVNGTPAFFVNGLRYDGPWYSPELFIESLGAD